MECDKCGCNATEDNWVGGFPGGRHVCERCRYGNGDVVCVLPGIPTPLQLSLRDWFAGQALATLDLMNYHNAEALADVAYDIADAMLKERAK